jgi:tripartite-type tricarboxylate transporter receptor subunit TctC
MLRKCIFITAAFIALFATHANCAQALDTPDIKSRMTSQGADPAYLNSESFSKFLTNELIRWGKVVKSSGATLD